MKEFFESLIGKDIKDTYRIEKLLGSGGMGSVFKAKHIHLGTNVAVKVLAPHFANDTSLVKRFQREAQVGWKLTHPSIIKVMDLGKTEDGVLYMVMEYVEGETLDAHLERSGPLALERCLEILEPLCDALASAHEQNILHRDLKPANIMVSTKKDQTVVKLLDFGIVKLLQSEEHVSALTAVGEVFGTPIYMAPEHLMGLTVGPTADVYSLGVITYLMLTGHLPADHDDLRKLFEMKMKELPTPSERFPFLPKQLDPILKKVLASRLDQRYQNVTEFFQALKAAANEISAFQNQTTFRGKDDQTPIAEQPTRMGVVGSGATPVPIQEEQTAVYSAVAAKSSPQKPTPPKPPAPSPASKPAPASGSSAMIWIGLAVVIVIVVVLILRFAR